MVYVQRFEKESKGLLKLSEIVVFHDVVFGEAIRRYHLLRLCRHDKTKRQTFLKERASVENLRVERSRRSSCMWQKKMQ